MIYKLKLKNSDRSVLLSADAYEYIANHLYLKDLNFLQNLRLHSNGYAFFQKNHPIKEGGYRNETIYLHRFIAEKFIGKPDSQSRLFVKIKNGNPLDCRLSNLEWVPFSRVIRGTSKTRSKTGYRGVHKEHNRYRAVLYDHGQRHDLGYYDSPEQAAEAYNKKSEELFGKTRSLNKIKRISSEK
ncbi:MAG: HNH endonuclease [Catalinimonas sp.]